MKTIHYLSLACLLCLSAGLLQAQQQSRYYMPLEIQKAYENGTRSYDGKPGSKYWQNTADYKLEVSIDPKARKIDGTGEAVYHNNSPNELRTLVVRLYYDAFRKGNARADAVGPTISRMGLRSGGWLSTARNMMSKTRGSSAGAAPTFISPSRSR